MKNKQEWTYPIEYCDRGKWPRAYLCEGEPDKVQWTAKTGLPCLAVRHPRYGHWCGYAGVNPGHKWHQAQYSVVNEWSWEDDDRALEELTFASLCQDTGEPGKHVCHIAEKGEPEHVYWLGFDFAHSGHSSPSQKSDCGHFYRYITLAGVIHAAEAWSAAIAENES